MDHLLAEISVSQSGGRGRAYLGVAALRASRNVLVVFSTTPLVESSAMNQEQKLNAEVTSTPPTDVTSGVAMIDKPGGSATTLGTTNVDNSALANAGVAAFSQEINTFLTKWIELGATVITAATDTIAFWKLPDDWLATATTPMLWDKLKGFQGIRGTLEIKLSVNANPFQQGRILVVYLPMYDGNANVSMDAIIYQRLAHLTTMTQLPRFELDLASQTSGIIEVPYINTHTFYDLNAHTGPWGMVYAYMYSPLAFGSGSTQCSLTAWIRIKPGTLELVNPTQPGTSPVGLVPKWKRGVHKNIRSEMQGTATGRKKAPVEKEERAMSLGPISGALSVAGKIASAAGNIPLLSSVAKPVSWALDLVAHGAAAFGYSKPMVDDTVLRVHNSYSNPYTHTYDGQTIGLHAGSSFRNETCLMPRLGGTDEDEMSFDYVLQKSCYITQFLWSNTATAGDTLGEFELAPSSMGVPVTYTNGTVYFAHPAWYLAQNFNFYRGDIILTVKMVKTAYHTGRFMVSFFPGYPDLPATLATEYCLRDIIDLEEGIVWSKRFPFTSNRPYLDTDVAYGTVSFNVVTDLRGPETVADNITLLVEVSCAPGFEFANWNPLDDDTYVPIDLRSMGSVTFGGSLRPNHGLVMKKDRRAKPIRSEMESDHYAGPIGIGGAGPPAITYEPAKLCIGERFTTFRQLTAIATRCGIAMENSGSSTYTSAWIRPWSVRISTMGGGVLTSPQFGLDLYAIIAQMYRFNRGGVMLVVETTSTATLAGTAWMYKPNLNEYDLQSWSYSTNPGFIGYSYMGHTKWQPLVVRIPPYSDTHAWLIRPVADAETEPLDAYANPNSVVISLDRTATTAAKYLKRCSVEGSQFGFFIGLPPMIQFTSFPTAQDHLSKPDLDTLDCRHIPSPEAFRTPPSAANLKGKAPESPGLASVPTGPGNAKPGWT